MEPEVINQVAQNLTPQNVAVTFQTLFNVAVAVIAFTGGFVVNRLFNQLDNLTKQDKILSKEINTLNVNLPTFYVMKEDLQRLSDALFLKLDSIESKLDKKQDKG